MLGVLQKGAGMDGMLAAESDRVRLTAMVAAGEAARAEPLLRELHAREGVRLWSANLLAVCLRQQRRFDEAIPLYRRLLNEVPGEGALWGNLANALTDSLRWNEALAVHRRALSLSPDSADGWASYGRTLARLGKGPEAREAFRKALSIGHGNPAQVEWDICLTWLVEGDYAKGWPLYDRRWSMARSEANPFPGPRWDGTPAPGATLYLHSEQGFGDTIQCLRYLSLAAARVGRIVLAIQPPLHRLAKEIAPEGTVILPRGSQPEPGWLIGSMLDLPRLFTASPDAVPCGDGYLRAPAEAREKMAKILPPRGDGPLRVGIVWSGSLTFQHNDVRRARLPDFVAAFAQPGVQLYSLQKGPPEADLAALSGAPVIDLAPHLDDFADTAAACEALDLVIMTDSAVAHLCGALNRPVWVLMGPLLHWPWGKESESTPWYRSVKLIRQPAPGCWAPVFDRAAAALAESRS